MIAKCILVSWLLVGIGSLLTGCGSNVGNNGGIVSNVGGGAINAAEERNLTASHVAGSGLDVDTGVGSVDIAADPSLKEVTIVAKVTAFGDSDEEAKARLKDIKVKIGRRDDRVLQITVEHPKEWKGLKGACSFVIRVPEVSGSTVRTGNGSVTLKGLGGAAHVNSGVGSITISDQSGIVEAQTGNGGIYVNKATGDVAHHILRRLDFGKGRWWRSQCKDRQRFSGFVGSRWSNKSYYLRWLHYDSGSRRSGNGRHRQRYCDGRRCEGCGESQILGWIFDADTDRGRRRRRDGKRVAELHACRRQQFFVRPENGRRFCCGPPAGQCWWHDPG